ncbi:hypothetical protein [Streptomyces sp. NBC_00620]|uniref:hypothetical protein n=1 Tax=unclassified Streptomyces TaxID=2593676 RepID=UPI0022536A35|nr:hypothetical protein [Streptomyces sp. NBC_00620]MCX4979481.1 hypothetical protein [Streptomyces sp. NBC_00620]WUC14254.1 hypothetical protein OG256_32290 [Streptomyces sp. NBC_00564]
MSVQLRLVYAEYESGEPPFVWLDGKGRRPEEKRRAIHLIGGLSREGRHRRGEPGLAIRHRDSLLIQTTVGLAHDSGGPQGAVAIVKGLGSGADWEADVTELIAEVLRDGRITVDREKFRSVLEWGAQSWAQALKEKKGIWFAAAKTRRTRTEEKAVLARMYIPEELADRLMTVSREDLVRISDDDPERLRDHRITIVPVPLFGRWKHFPELRETVLYPDQAYVRDRDSGYRYAAVDNAIQGTALRKCRLALKVCKELGAKSLYVIESRADSGSFSVGNEYTAQARAERAGEAHKKLPKASLSIEEQSLLHLAAQLRHDLKVTIEAEGNWPGHAPSIAGALSVLEGYDPSDVEDLRIFIEQRDGAHNVSTSLSLVVNLLSELNRDFDLFCKTAAGLEATLGRQQAKAEMSMSNTFKVQFERTRMVSLSLKVEF